MVSETDVLVGSEAYKKARITEVKIGTELHKVIVGLGAVHAVQNSCATAAEYERKRKRHEDSATAVPASSLSTKYGLVLTDEVIQAGRKGLRDKQEKQQVKEARGAEYREKRRRLEQKRSERAEAVLKGMRGVGKENIEARLRTTKGDRVSNDDLTALCHNFTVLPSSKCKEDLIGALLSSEAFLAAISASVELNDGVVVAPMDDVREGHGVDEGVAGVPPPAVITTCMEVHRVPTLSSLGGAAPARRSTRQRVPSSRLFIDE